VPAFEDSDDENEFIVRWLKWIRNREDHFHSLDDTNFMVRFRLAKRTVLSVLESLFVFGSLSRLALIKVASDIFSVKLYYLYTSIYLFLLLLLDETASFKVICCQIYNWCDVKLISKLNCDYCKQFQYLEAFSDIIF